MARYWNLQNINTTYGKSKFGEFQASKDKEIKALATRFALNEMKLNKWWGSEREWENVYQTVWVEKLMQIELSYNVAEILGISKQLLSGQQKIITALGVIVSNQGEILYNQEIIITNQGIIIDVTGEILLNTEEIIVTTNNILGVVEDIQGTVNDISANGVKIKSNKYTKGIKSYLKYIAYGLGGVLLLVIILKTLKKKK